ncbi:hypothetical protein LTR04_000924 [Oleoguttula sp. CCFEE 6159]|nr:hypothetical protein LTR04_000924 [Oleoguttula sp. CCFEE 6159]
MSGLISSFLIEPVVRQARRFSASRTSSDTATPTNGRLSHVRAGVRSRDADAASIATAPVVDPSNSAGSNEGDGDGDVPRTDHVYDHSIDTSTVAEEEDESSHNNADRRHAPPFTESPAPHDESSTSFPDLAPEDEMSENPLYGIPGRFRSTDTLGSAASARGSLSSQDARSHSTSIGTPRSTGETGGGYNTAFMSGSLPEDDGMRMLRHQIHMIRQTGGSNEEMARMMHELMTKEYHASQAHILRATSPSSPSNSNLLHTPASTLSGTEAEMQSSSPSSASLLLDPETQYNLTPQDRLPTYCPKSPRDPSTASPVSSSSDEEETLLGCAHYKRNVKIQCFDCHKWYTCRHCHDEDPHTDHPLNRTRTAHMFCMLCGTPQAAGEECKQCGQRAAWYYCDICKLWDDDAQKKIYHCSDCGICRRGEGLGKDFVHCKRATDCDCPICATYLFTSSTPVVSMPCGHYMHAACHVKYMETAYRCPFCNRSAVNMELQWRKLDQAIETQPMPEQYAETKAFVRCNDCGGKGWTRYHWLGNKCTTCDSYNTNEVKLSGPDGQIAPEPAPAVIADRQAIIGLAPSNTERVDSAIDPASPPRRPVQRTTGSYFLTADDDGPRPATAEESRPSLPYQMFQRVSRSLSPMRYYLEGLDTENDAEMADVGHVEGRRKEDGNDDADDWEDDDGESEDSDESMDDEDDPGEAEDGDEEMDGMEIFGHR